ncbi:sugar transferase [candidate division KSB1 bacterium]|nr:sugar transferase [candidate division KSB1 bacterium]
MNVRPHQILLVIGDLLVMNGVFLTALWVQYQSGIVGSSIQPYPFQFVPFFVLCSVFSTIAFHYNGLFKYQNFTRRFGQLFRILKSFLESYVGILIIAFFLKHELLIQRLTLGISFFILTIVFFMYRCMLLPLIYNALTSSGDLKKNVIIVGAGKHGRKLAKDINDKNNAYFSAIGFLDDNERYQQRFLDDVPVFGRVTDISKVSKINKIDEILIAIDNVSHEKLLDVVRTCSRVRKPIHVVSDLYKVIPELLEVEKFDGISSFRVKAPTSRMFYHATKRMMDILISVGLFTVLSPVLTLIAVLIKATSKGPVIYKRDVVGKNEKIFTFYKFRTMRTNNDDTAHQKYVADIINGNGTDNNNGKKKVFKIQNDPRITKIGKILRKLSLDELPQLFNVLKGEMSLIGPRPCTVDEYHHYKPWHKERFAVTPGITGLYQVTGRSTVNYDDMVVLDLYYKEHQSLWLDLEIMTKTIPTMLFGKGAY